MFFKFLAKRAFISLSIALFLTLVITVYPLKDTQASILINDYLVSSNGDDGYTYIIIQPGTPPQITEYFLDEEDHVLMLSISSTCYTWFRFQNVNIPQRAIIESATLQVRAYEDNAHSTRYYRVQGFDEDNATAPTGYTDWMNRPKTSAYQDVLATEFVKDFWYDYLWLRGIVQEIVDRQGWASGNSLVLCSSAEVSTFAQSVLSYEGADNIGALWRAPKLVITYSIPIRDVAVTEITPVKTQLTPGEVLSISVVVGNEGQLKETFDVTLYYDDNAIDTQTASDLDSSATERLDFYWNTTGVAEGDYTIKAVATSVSGETDTADNTMIDGIVTLDIQESPNASFDWSPSLPNEGETIYFDASESTDPDGSITKYEWDWTNDGTYDDLKSSSITTHTYVSASTYTVKLMVTDNDGLTDQTEKTITVSTVAPPPNDPPLVPIVIGVLTVAAVVVFFLLRRKR